MFKNLVLLCFYDLNSDGVNEIIGFVSEPVFFCVQGPQLFILKKENCKYVDLSLGINSSVHEGITVLGSKTNEYYDMQIKFTAVKLNTVLQKEYNTVVKIIYDEDETVYKYFLEPSSAYL